MHSCVVVIVDSWNFQKKTTGCLLSVVLLTSSVVSWTEAIMLIVTKEIAHHICIYANNPISNSSHTDSGAMLVLPHKRATQCCLGCHPSNWRGRKWICIIRSFYVHLSEERPMPIIHIGIQISPFLASCGDIYHSSAAPDTRVLQAKQEH